jgi:hypothetical protein
VATVVAHPSVASRRVETLFSDLGGFLALLRDCDNEDWRTERGSIQNGVHVQRLETVEPCTLSGVALNVGGPRGEAMAFYEVEEFDEVVQIPPFRTLCPKTQLELSRFAAALTPEIASLVELVLSLMDFPPVAQFRKALKFWSRAEILRLDAVYTAL